MFGGASADVGKQLMCDGSNGPIFVSYKVFEFTSASFSQLTATGTFNPLSDDGGYSSIVGAAMVFYNGALQTSSEIAVAANGTLTIQNGNTLTNNLPMRLVAHCIETS